MHWVELTDNVPIAGKIEPPGKRVCLGYVAAQGLVLSGRATWSGPPEDGQPEPTPDPTPDEPVETPAAPDEADPTHIEDVDFRSIEGVGPATEEDLLEAFQAAGVTTAQQALELELSTLPVDSDLVEPVRDLLEASVDTDSE